MAYSDDVNASESQRQQDHKAASTEAQHVTADANHRQRLVTAARKWGVKNEALRHIIEKGEALPAGSCQPGEL